jgi:hypothetical protein
MPILSQEGPAKKKNALSQGRVTGRYKAEYELFQPYPHPTGIRLFWERNR